MVSFQSSPTCAFCFEATTRTRLCLTPECANCAAARQEHSYTCLPECRFRHGPDQVQTTSRLVTMLKTALLEKLQSLISQSQADFIAAQRNQALARLYYQLDLTSGITVKQCQLVADQLEFQLQRCHQAETNLITIDNSEPFLTQSLTDLARMDDFMTNYPIETSHQPLLLTLLPGVSDLVVLLYCHDPQYDGWLYLNLTRSEYYLCHEFDPDITGEMVTTGINAQVKPDWLPSWATDFKMYDFLAFSADGVWLRDLDKTILKHLTLTPFGRVTTVNLGDERYISCLASDSVAQTTRLAFVSIGSDWQTTLTAWQLPAWRGVSETEPNTWTRLWSQPCQDPKTMVLSPRHIIMATNAGRNITILDFETGSVVSTVDLGQEYINHGVKVVPAEPPEILRASLADYRLHLVSHHGENGFSRLDYHIYGLDGQLLYYKNNFYPHNRRYQSSQVSILIDGGLDGRLDDERDDRLDHGREGRNNRANSEVIDDGQNNKSISIKVLFY